MGTDKLHIGSSLPECKLSGVDGQLYQLTKLNKSGLVVIFTCNHCPYVQAYEERIKSLQNIFTGKTSVVAINSNDSDAYPEDSFNQMIERSTMKNFNFPYLRDEDQSTAIAFGASHTPEAFLFDKNNKLCYHGKIDDNWQEPENVRTPYLKNAIEEMLTGMEVSIPETFSIGCTIKWKNLI